MRGSRALAFDATMALRWECLAEPKRGGAAEWELMQFDLPLCPETLEEAFSRGHSQHYSYTVTHNRSYGATQAELRG